MKDRIKLIRKENKLTQSEMAEKLNVTQSVVAAYENGKREPRNNVIATICEKFDVCEKWLRTGEGPMRPTRTRQQEFAFMMGQAMAEGNEIRLAALSVLARIPPDRLEFAKELVLSLAAEFQKTEKEPES